MSAPPVAPASIIEAASIPGAAAASRAAKSFELAVFAPPKSSFILPMSVAALPNFDNNSFYTTITYDIIGAEVPPQELQFALQSTR